MNKVTAPEVPFGGYEEERRDAPYNISLALGALRAAVALRERRNDNCSVFIVVGRSVEVEAEPAGSDNSQAIIPLSFKELAAILHAAEEMVGVGK